MDERVKFIADVLKGERNIKELCELYQISRKTGYKWIERFEEAGPSGLEDLGRRPKSCAHVTPEPIMKQILELRYTHPTWGARKLRARLEQTRGDTDWPSASTVNAILRRAGLVHAQKRKRRVTPSTIPFDEVTAPNQLWCMDFKGFFRCGNKDRCDPFTITDAFSRYIIRCQAVPSLSGEHVDSVCDAAMREYGLPERIRTDNGSPFATTTVLGLSRLTAKWKRLGIVHERIEPGEPQQNGRHERMHRTLNKKQRSRRHLRCASSRIVSMSFGSASMNDGRMKRCRLQLPLLCTWRAPVHFRSLCRSLYTANSSWFGEFETRGTSSSDDHASK